MDHGSIPLCSVLTPPSVASGHSKNNEDLKQHNSELEEKLRLLVIEKSAMKLGIEELQKKLEMSELLLQQFSSQPTPDSSQQLQQALEERAQLETHMEQLKDSLRQLQAERDQYATNLKEENAIWQQKMQQVLEQVRCDLQSPPPPTLDRSLGLPGHRVICCA